MAAAVLAMFCVVVRLIQSPQLIALDRAALQGDRLILLLVAYIVVKSIHELSHGLACIRYGTQCKELGLLILFFTPCMYCDTTDAWRLPSKWQRAAICAAGMYAEMILATMAAFVWLGTQTGLAHVMAGNVMLIASLGTLFVNGNPFLKYDGYYIASDLWNVPNLSEQSREATWLFFRRWMTGEPVETYHLDRSLPWLVTYAIVSLIYRTFILVVILWLAWYSLVPIGLGFLTLMIFAGIGLGLVLSTYRSFVQWRRSATTGAAVRPLRFLCLMMLLVGIGYFVSQVPLPVYVRTRGVTDYGDKLAVYAPDHATLVRSADRGRRIAAGELLAEFECPEKSYRLEVVRSEIKLLRERITSLNQTASIDPTASLELTLHQELLAESLAKESLLEKEIGSLRLTAGSDGVLLGSSTELKRPLTAPEHMELDLRPASPSNQGCTLNRGALVGWFTAKGQTEVTAIVSESDMKRLRLGMIAACGWDSDIQNIVHGRIVRIAPDPVERTPDELVGDAGVVSLRNNAGVFEPELPHYAVTIAFDELPSPRLRGSLVTVQIHVASQPLLQTIIRMIRLSLKPV